MSKRLLLDNDIFLLLSGAGLLEDAIAALGFTLAQARRPDALAHMLRQRARALSKYSEEILARTADDCARIAAIDEEPDAAMMELFAAHGAQVHGGEAVLLALTAAHGAYLLGTNDENALRCVAGEPGLIEIRERVAGRVISAPQRVAAEDSAWEKAEDLMKDRAPHIAITARDLYTGHRVCRDAKSAERLLSAWKEEGRIESFEREHKGAGRPATACRLAKRPRS